jgi:hypothetical protein
LLEASAPPPAAASDGDPAALLVRAAAGAILASATLARSGAEHSLRGDLGFDSLMLLELLVALENQVGRASTPID